MDALRKNSKSKKYFRLFFTHNIKRDEEDLQSIVFSSFFQTALLGSVEVQLRYIDEYKQLAIKEMERTGIPASIKIA
ncbi:MAG: hypothetical protein HC892_03140, partial [Saprospiraceae bacterium]|nr:hypothetical protein [Saprospiraceae bacterium]